LLGDEGRIAICIEEASRLQQRQQREELAFREVGAIQDRDSPEKALPDGGIWF
jgi:hypothetical protein